MVTAKSPAVPPPPECHIVARLEVSNPLHAAPTLDTVRPIPAGVRVRVVSVNNPAATLVQAVTDATGLADFPPFRFGKRRVVVLVDFPAPYLDLDAQTMVPAAGLALDDPRRLIRFPTLWDSRLQRNRFRDNRGGRLENGVLRDVQVAEGTAASPWRIQLDFAWDKLWVRFDYYNTLSRSVEGMHRRIRVEVYRGNNMTAGNVVAAGTPLDDAGRVYLAIYRTTPTNQQVIGFRAAADSFWLMDEPDRTQRLRVVSTATYDAMPMTDRQRHFPVPSVWRSSGHWTRMNAGDPVRYQARMADPATLVNNSKANPIRFHLDDFVLVNASGTAIGWNAANRFSIFDHQMEIRDPDADHPYWTTQPATPPGILAQNGFLAETFAYRDGFRRDQSTRVIAHNRTFYDLLNRRTTRGAIVGARAAMANQHPVQRIWDPWQRQADSGAVAGNYHLHYFHECTLVPGPGAEPLSFVVPYWSVRFRAGPGVTPADVARFRRDGLARSIERHGYGPLGLPVDKDYYLMPYVAPGAPAPTPRRMKVRPFFEARDAQPVHAVVRIVQPPFRSEMGPNAGTLAVGDETTAAPPPPPPPAPPPPPPAPANDGADGNSALALTMAHETGHSLGLDDEYLERIPGWSLPRFQQWYPGMPYSCEREMAAAGPAAPPVPPPGNPPLPMPMPLRGRQLMFSNRLLRMRYHWWYANWVNTFNPVRALVNNQLHEVSYSIPAGALAGTRLELFLERTPRDVRNPYRPRDRQRNFQHRHGRMDLFLYKLGNEESAHFNIHPTLRDIDAILVVRLNMHFSFIRRNGSPAWPIWPPNTPRVVIMREFEIATENLTYATNRFTLEVTPPPAAPDPDPTRPSIRKCFVYFRPFYATVSPAGANYRLRARRQHATAANNLPDIMDPAFTATTINIVENHTTAGVPAPATNMISLFRYCIGLDAVTAPAVPPAPAPTPAPVPIVTLTAPELQFLADWLGSVTSLTYAPVRY